MSEARPALRDEAGQSRYRRVSTRIWNDRRFRDLSEDGKLLFFFLLTTPETTGVPGLFRAREIALAADMGWSQRRFRGAFRELNEQGMALADWSAGLVWLPNALKHDPPANPNVVTSWGRIVRNDLPECGLLLQAISRMREWLGQLFENSAWATEAFDKAFPEPFLKGLAEGFPEPLPERLPKAGRPTPDAGHPIPDTSSRVPTPEGLAEVVEVDVREIDVAGTPVIRQHQVVRWRPTADGCWEGIQLWRLLVGLERETQRPKDFAEWFEREFRRVGADGIDRAIRRYLTDDGIRARGRPTAVFITPGIFDQRAEP